MSGGHFNYDQYKIGYIADEVEQLIITNGSEEKDEWGYGESAWPIHRVPHGDLGTSVLTFDSQQEAEKFLTKHIGNDQIWPQIGRAHV